jgi:pyruvate/2-oxoglutarate dehydrogenase complex dihydrolipoamide acyltransferase (E2) component
MSFSFKIFFLCIYYNYRRNTKKFSAKWRAIMTTAKRRFGDRRDGRLIRDMDGMHIIMAHLLPHRSACETSLNEKIDLTNILAYLEQKNSSGGPVKYTIFHIIAAALGKTLTLRPHLNRFIAGRRYYQRHKVTLAFVVKRQFSDSGGEGLLVLTYPPEGNVDTLAERVTAEAHKTRGGDLGESLGVANTIARLPRFLTALVIRILRILDFYGRVPEIITKGDPNHASVLLSNLGSIKLNAAYHHLNDWGTNSLFLAIGEKHRAVFYNEQGEAAVREAINLSITLDERLADGYYYSRSIKLLKYLLQNPQLLELPAKEEVSYDN